MLRGSMLRGSMLQGSMIQKEEMARSASIDSEIAVLILDTIGDLKQFIAHSDFCLIGGSLVNAGGHNPLEACGVGVPVLFGLSMHNFKQIAREVQQCNAGIAVANAQALTDKVQLLARDEAQRMAMGEQGRKLIERNKGALNKTLAIIAELNNTA